LGLGIGLMQFVDVEHRRAHADATQGSERGAELFAHADRREGMPYQTDVGEWRVHRPGRSAERIVPPPPEQRRVLGVPQRLEEAMAEAQVRFEVGSLGPFVPGVDEDQSLVATLHQAGLADRRFGPGLEGPWRGVLEAEAVVLPTGGVVPAGDQPAKAGIGGLIPLTELGY